LLPPRLRLPSAAIGRQPYIWSRPETAMSKQYYRIILILLTVACALGALVTAPIALLTAGMAFDAPGSEYQTWAWIIFFIVLSIPLWFVIGVIAGWFLFVHDWPRTSLLLTATPLAAVTIGWLLLQSA
jgi:uncharacterized membrane protein SpoIIM required for sporulation